MYSRYAESKKWKIDVNNALEGTSGGFTQSNFQSGEKMSIQN